MDRKGKKVSLKCPRPISARTGSRWEPKMLWELNKLDRCSTVRARKPFKETTPQPWRTLVVITSGELRALGSKCIQRAEALRASPHLSGKTSIQNNPLTWNINPPNLQTPDVLRIPGPAPNHTTLLLVMLPWGPPTRGMFRDKHAPWRVIGRY